MSKSRWEKFEGNHFEVGRLLGLYWGQRLTDFNHTGYGRYILRLLKKPRRLRGQILLEKEFSKKFPKVADELDGMVEGIRAAGYRKASFGLIFRFAVGEIDGHLLGCSTIVRRAPRVTFLAHNEEDEELVPLCYAHVKIKDEPSKPEFLSISYPFQLFGSSVGANAKIAVTGNSIGMDDKTYRYLKRTLSSRISKTVLSRLILEQNSIEDVIKLLRSSRAALPNHWYVASASKVVSIELRPTTRSRADQVRVFTVRRNTECHTNHFQHGDWKRWVWNKRERDESTDRLGRLQSLARCPHDSTGSGRATMGRLHRVLRALRSQTDDGEATTLSTVVMAVGRHGTTVQMYDYFDRLNRGARTVSSW